MPFSFRLIIAINTNSLSICKLYANSVIVQALVDEVNTSKILDSIKVICFGLLLLQKYE